jgi:hypothetical protein
MLGVSPAHAVSRRLRRTDRARAGIHRTPFDPKPTQRAGAGRARRNKRARPPPAACDRVHLHGSSPSLPALHEMSVRQRMSHSNGGVTTFFDLPLMRFLTRTSQQSRKTHGQTLHLHVRVLILDG